MKSRTATLVTRHNDGAVEIVWAIRYNYEPVTPATWHAPAEGGVELEGHPWPIEVNYAPHLGEEFSITGLGEGCILGILLTERWGLPDLADQYEACEGDVEERSCPRDAWG